MDKRILLAGLIAGIVAACADPAVDMLSDAMRDAGRVMVDAGGRLRDAGMGPLADAAIDAGVAIRDAGAMLADSGAGPSDAGSSDAHAQEPAGDGLPRPHWVLRDGSGDPVTAYVYPGYDARALRFANEPHECAHIDHVGARRIGLGYRLSTGELDERCGVFVTSATWRDSAYGYFLASDCTGQAYAPGAQISVKIGNAFYYTDGEPSQHAATYYRWSGASAMCVAVSPAAGQDLWAFKPVPSDIVNLLNNPPYTLELAY